MLITTIAKTCKFEVDHDPKESKKIPNRNTAIKQSKEKKKIKA
jgi:hypothetical protein